MKIYAPASALFTVSTILVYASIHIHVVSASEPALLRGSVSSKLHLDSFRESSNKWSFLGEEEEGQEGCRLWGACSNCKCNCCYKCRTPEDGSVDYCDQV
mmetsp:Transcript_24599/g.59302  ORF Transcript_24599/g.59302 Transcript_24599/m.59302 type:complete len:100 (-) Transcript_24599:170-469(-)